MLDLASYTRQHVRAMWVNQEVDALIRFGRHLQFETKDSNAPLAYAQAWVNKHARATERPRLHA